MSGSNSLLADYACIGFRYLMFWEKDDKRKGLILRTIHHAFMYGLATMILVSHTLMSRSFLLLLCIYLVVVSIWIQHIATGGCIISKVEHRFIGDSKNFVDPFMEFFHIPVSDESAIGITIMGSTCVVMLMGLEVVSRAIALLYDAWH
jgi:hypothetical protein